jgi:hypothetical protein
MAKDPQLHRKSAFTRYAFFWITLILFVGSFAGNLIFGWKEFAQDQEEHGQQPQVSDYVPQAARGVFENWQAEFMSVLWQLGGLALFYAVGSPQSREGNERMEEKIDLILRAVEPKEGEKEQKALDKSYARK